MKGCLADTDDGRRSDLACGIEPGIVEARNDVRIGSRRIRFAHFHEQARQRHRLVEVAFDRDRPRRRRDGFDGRAGCCSFFRRALDRRRHRGGGVRIDDPDAHAG